MAKKTSEELIKTAETFEVAEAVLLSGDLARMTKEERTKYYLQVCRAVGLNPATQPFEFITLNGKLKMYAGKNCAEQLRKIHGVSIEITSTQTVSDCYVVAVSAKDKSRRTDASTGVVPIKNLAGEALANAMMKAETKAKRRVTLSIVGLGMLDETEVDSTPGVPADRSVMIYDLGDVREAPEPKAQELPVANFSALEEAEKPYIMRPPVLREELPVVSSSESPEEIAEEENDLDFGEPAPPEIKKSAGEKLVEEYSIAATGSLTFAELAGLYNENVNVSMKLKVLDAVHDLTKKACGDILSRLAFEDAINDIDLPNTIPAYMYVHWFALYDIATKTKSYEQMKKQYYGSLSSMRREKVEAEWTDWAFKLKKEHATTPA